MDPKTRSAITTFRPSLEGALSLLREAEKLQPATNPGFEKLLAARCELEQVLGLANDVVLAQRTAEQLLAEVAADEGVKRDAAQHQVRELLHLGTKARAQAERGLAQLVKVTRDPASMATSLPDAAKAFLEVDRLFRQGTCGCSPAAGCGFAVPSKPQPRQVAMVVKGPPKLSVVKGEG
jgi:hypothetical protein